MPLFLLSRVTDWLTFFLPGDFFSSRFSASTSSKGECVKCCPSCQFYFLPIQSAALVVVPGTINNPRSSAGILINFHDILMAIPGTSELIQKRALGMARGIRSHWRFYRVNNLMIVVSVLLQPLLRLPPTIIRRVKWHSRRSHTRGSRFLASKEEEGERGFREESKEWLGQVQAHQMRMAFSGFGYLWHVNHDIIDSAQPENFPSEVARQKKRTLVSEKLQRHENYKLKSLFPSLLLLLALQVIQGS